MVSDNPFISITYAKSDTIVNRVNEKIELLILLNEAMDHGGVVVIKGAPGMGKSTIINAIGNEIKKSKKIEIIYEEFTPAVYNKIRSIDITPSKKILLVLDDFNNIEMLDKLSQQRVIDLLYNLSQNLAMMLVENRDEGIEKDFERQEKNFRRYEIKELSKGDMKQIIINRLNTTRKSKSDSLDPFTPAEFEKIYKKSRGNPRIALLICSALYDQKTNSVI